MQMAGSDLLFLLLLLLLLLRGSRRAGQSMNRRLPGKLGCYLRQEFVNLVISSGSPTEPSFVRPSERPQERIAVFINFRWQEVQFSWLTVQVKLITVIRLLLRNASVALLFLEDGCRGGRRQ